MPNLQTHPNVEIAVRYHEAVSRFAAGEELARFLHEDVVHHELPNALFPEGNVRDLAGMLKAGEAGRGVLSDQVFEVVNAVAAGDQVALEVKWRGTLAVPLGELPAGHVLRAHIAAFLDFRDGKIVAQRNYDCYEPRRL
ncbi:nuclear transport factor 2 family protein [Thermoactinospora rubra]|uniref:nuclear transport factor 2 family protein n=1 Tax=Thermoactinospora rubra TaxID=1088767 RepID=UPI001F0B126E|nr:nuclear transport factor 2 family protein [Thermoactinospora rubra]